MNSINFKATLKQLEPEEFCRQYLFSADAWIFDPASSLSFKGSYEEFRRTISTVIDEPETNVAVVGSSKFGFSMNPNAPYAPFRADSDVDIVIVSEKLFQRIWGSYRDAYYNGYNMLKRVQSGNVFRNFVVVPSQEYSEFKSIYLRKIWIQMHEMVKHVQTNHRISLDVNFRIYSSWADAEAYHAYGLSKLKETLT